MTNIWNSNFNVGDKVLYLGSETIPYDKDGNEWNQTGEKIGNTYYYNGTDSDGNTFSGSCDSYSGCSNNY